MAPNYKALRAAAKIACKSDPARYAHLVFRVAVVVVSGRRRRGSYTARTAAGEKAEKLCTFWLEERLQSTQQQENNLPTAKLPCSHPEK